MITKQMSEIPTIQIWEEPPTQETGSSSPCVLTQEADLLLAYSVRNLAFPGWDKKAPPNDPGLVEKSAVLRFKTVLIFSFGYPNSEALGGHPLYRFGLKHYGFHWVENSPWIAKLRAQNRTHPQHRDALWEKWRHWIVTFEDKTLEVIAASASTVGNFDAVNPLQALNKVVA